MAESADSAGDSVKADGSAAGGLQGWGGSLEPREPLVSYRHLKAYFLRRLLLIPLTLLGITALVFAAFSDSAYAIVAGRAGKALSARRVKLLSRLSGGFLIGGGLWLAFSRAK